MNHRHLAPLLTLIALVSFSAVPAICQTQTAAAGTWTAPLTSWGDPDLQGQWNSQTSTPLQRPREGPLAGRDTLTLEEAETLEATNRANFDLPPREGSVGNYNAFWRDVGKALTRTSLIIDPPDGRMPLLSPEGQARIDAERAERSTRGPSNSPDTYKDLSQWTRCISRGWNGIGSWYSSNYQIFQSAGYVVVFQELIHEARIIPLDGRPHLPGSISLWMGDSRGHWEGNTLVVDVTNFTENTWVVGHGAPPEGAPASALTTGHGVFHSDDLHVVERFTLRDADTIHYEVTIEDPQVFTQPWTIAFDALVRAPEDHMLFEYACHEGNHGLPGILAGWRRYETMGMNGDGTPKE